MNMVRALLHTPAQARVGEVIEIRAHIQHAMETGYRQGPENRLLPRDLVRRVECHFDGQLVFAAELHAAIAANPYLAFFMTAERSGTISVTWRGDQALERREVATLTVVP